MNTNETSNKPLENEHKYNALPRHASESAEFNSLWLTKNRRLTSIQNTGLVIISGLLVTYGVAIEINLLKSAEEGDWITFLLAGSAVLFVIYIGCRGLWRVFSDLRKKRGTSM